MRCRSRLHIVLLAAAAVFTSAAGAKADVLAEIKSRGALMAGVKPDYPPFSFRDPSGKLVGLEVDLAQDLADRLGVPLKLMSVSASSRMQFLQQGAIDLILATMAVTEDRAKEIGLVEPHYYASGVALLTAKAAGIGSGADLGGKRVCTIDAAYYNDQLAAMAADIELVPLPRPSDGEDALRDGRCAALANEDVRLIQRKRADEAKWADYQIVPLDMPPLPWAIGVKSGETDAPFGKLVAETVAEWHRSGKLLELEKKWLGENTRWLEQQHDELK